MYVNVDTPNLGFTYFNFLGGGLKNHPVFFICIFCIICVMNLLQGSHAWGLFARQLLRVYPPAAAARLQDVQRIGWKERAAKVQYAKPFFLWEIVWFNNLQENLFLRNCVIPHFQVVRAIVVRWASSCLQVGFDFKLGNLAIPDLI